MTEHDVSSMGKREVQLNRTLEKSKMQQKGGEVMF